MPRCTVYDVQTPEVVQEGSAMGWIDIFFADLLSSPAVPITYRMVNSDPNRNAQLQNSQSSITLQLEPSALAGDKSDRGQLQITVTYNL
jgi:hypothetical protein